VAKRKRNDYSKETEAAWFAVKEFLDLNNCSQYYEGAVRQMNPNELQCHVYSKTKVLKPYSYSKAMYDSHLLQLQTGYYRSQRKARHRKGYGGTDKVACGVSFAEDLGISQKRYLYDHTYYVMLLGLDIDAHNGETDASKVAEWLKTEYLTSSYWEPSTHFRGMHGYCKLAYPDHLPLEHVTEVLQEVYELLDRKRISLGFASPIDPPCGLPAQFTWDNEISVPSGLPAITTKDYYRYRDIRDSHNKKGISDQGLISPGLTYGDVDKVIRIPLPCSMKQSQCFKFPRFNATDPTQTSMVDIIAFHTLPFYSFDKFLGLRETLRKEFPEIPVKQATTDYSFAKKNTVILEHDKATADLPPSEEDTALFRPDGRSQEAKPRRLEGGEKIPCNLVSSPGSTKTATIDPTEANDRREVSGEGHRNRGSRARGWKRTGVEEYLKEIEETKRIVNKAALTVSFYFRYSDHLGRIPSIDEAEDEYIRLNLNRTKAKGVRGRIRRLKKARDFAERRWGNRKGRFDLGDWQEQKLAIIESILPRVEGIDRTWVKDRKRNQVYEIDEEELALVYHGICRSNELDEEAGGSDRMKYAFSYRQVQDCFGAEGRCCHRAKAGRILAILREARLIEPVGSYCEGQHGNRYRAVKADVIKRTDGALKG